MGERQRRNAGRAVGMNLRRLAPEVFGKTLLADEEPVIRERCVACEGEREGDLDLPVIPQALAGEIEARKVADSYLGEFAPISLGVLGAQHEHRKPFADFEEIIEEAGERKDRVVGRGPAKSSPSPTSSRKTPSNCTIWFSGPPGMTVARPTWKPSFR